jgi:hypothetical protein
MKIEGDVALIIGKMIKSKYRNFNHFAENEYLIEGDQLKIKCIFNDFELKYSKNSYMPSKSSYKYAGDIKLDYAEFIRELRELKIKRILDE